MRIFSTHTEHKKWQIRKETQSLKHTKSVDLIKRRRRVIKTLIWQHGEMTLRLQPRLHSTAESPHKGTGCQSHGTHGREDAAAKPHRRHREERPRPRTELPFSVKNGKALRPGKDTKQTSQPSSTHTGSLSRSVTFTFPIFLTSLYFTKNHCILFSTKMLKSK